MITIRVLQDSYNHNISSLVFSCVYLFLAIVDLITLLVTMRKLTRYLAEKKLAPEQNLTVLGLTCLKWVTVLSILFYTFITVCFYMNLSMFHKVYFGGKKVDVSEPVLITMLGYAVFYVVIGLAQLICLLWFQQRVGEKLSIGTRYSRIEDTYVGLEPIVYHQKVNELKTWWK